MTSGKPRPGVSRAAEDRPFDSLAIQAAQDAIEMKPGEVSDFVRKPDGGLLVVLEKREKIDPAQYESARPMVEGRALRNKTQIVFFEWLRERRRVAGVEETKPQKVRG